MQTQLRILATTDLHLHILPYDYFADRPAPHLGLAVLADLIARIRASSRNCILFDNGDFLLGTPLADVLGEGTNGISAGTHPAIRAMNMLDYDAACIGNHEFNAGLDYLERAASSANFPLLSANIINSNSSGPNPFRSDILIEKQLVTANGELRPIKIGVLRLTPPQALSWDKHNLPCSLSAQDMVQTAREVAPRLKSEGADIVIALCHSGLGEAEHINGMENAIVPLACIPEIDALVAGHTHLVFPDGDTSQGGPIDAVSGLIHGKPVVMAGSFGSHLGVIDLFLEERDRGWRICAPPRVQALPACAADAKSDAAMGQAVSHEHALTLTHIRRPIGETAQALHSYFAQVAPDPTLWLLAEAQRHHMVPLLSHSDFRDIPVAVAVAPFRSGGRAGPDNYIDIPAGPLTLRNAAELYPHPDKCMALLLTGGDIRHWLDLSAQGYLPQSGAEDRAPLLDLRRPSYFFDEMHGLTYDFDLSLSTPRCGTIRSNGRVLGDSDRIIVVTNSYRAGGGGGFVRGGNAPVICESAVNIRDLIVDYIRRCGIVRTKAAPTWRFAEAHRGQKVTFPSGPGARQHLGQPETSSIEDGPEAENGFVMYKATL